jgi:hypothetical protein
MVVSLSFSDYQLPQITKIQKLECTQFLSCISEVKVFHTIPRSSSVILSIYPRLVMILQEP